MYFLNSKLTSFILFLVFLLIRSSKAQLKFPQPTPIPDTSSFVNQHPNSYYEYSNSEEHVEISNLHNVSRYQATKCGPVEQEKVKECADPLYKMGAIKENSHYLGWEGFLFKTKAYFSEVCDNFFLFDNCIEAYKDVCFSADRARFNYDAAIKVLDFLCRDGYGEMSRNLECFTRTLTRSEMMQCQAELVSDTRKITETQSSEILLKNEAAICGAMRNYIECVKYPIRYECGYRAWQLVREMISQPTKALLPTCRLNSSNPIRKITFISFLILFFISKFL